MGVTFGVAIFMSILFSQVVDKIQAAFETTEVKNGFAEALADPSVASNPDNAGILEVLKSGPSGADGITNDSSFLIGADERLTLPFRIGFVDSSLTVFMLAAVFIAIAFIISWFIKEIPLRQKSAAQEAAEAAAAAH